MVMALGLRDIEYFVAIAEYGNLGRAAETLGLSQTALSKSLRRLESSMNTKLVRRTPRGVELTSVGTAFLSHVRRIRLSLDDVAREVADLTQGRAGHLRVGCGPDMIDLFVQRACSELMRSAPKVTLAVTTGINDVLFPALRNGEYDLIVSGLPVSPYEGTVHEHLLDDEFLVYSAAGHPLAHRKRVTIDDLTKQQWVLSNAGAFARSRWIRTFEQHGLPPPKVAVETNSVALMLHMVSASEFLGFVPRSVVRSSISTDRVIELPIKHASWSRQAGVSYRRDAYLSPAALRLLELLKTMARGITSQERA
jgi:DNA-binding transcriptional LysR family regulator